VHAKALGPPDIINLSMSKTQAASMRAEANRGHPAKRGTDDALRVDQGRFSLLDTHRGFFYTASQKRKLFHSFLFLFSVPKDGFPVLDKPTFQPFVHVFEK